MRSGGEHNGQGEIRGASHTRDTSGQAGPVDSPGLSAILAALSAGQHRGPSAPKPTHPSPQSAARGRECVEAAERLKNTDVLCPWDVRVWKRPGKFEEPLLTPGSASSSNICPGIFSKIVIKVMLGRFHKIRNLKSEIPEN
jgi:hypothetical protein